MNTTLQDAMDSGFRAMEFVGWEEGVDIPEQARLTEEEMHHLQMMADELAFRKDMEERAKNETETEWLARLGLLEMP